MTSTSTAIQNGLLNSGWEASNNQRRTLEYDGNGNVTVIYLEKLNTATNEWYKVFMQTLAYSGSNVISITGKSL